MIQPLSKEIYQTAKELGVTRIILHFSGGSDEGFLNVELDGEEAADDFYKQVENWAWSVYEYGGAGEGIEYGDNIEYDLVAGEVTHTEWHHIPESREHEPLKLELA
jgi:hypothetical protein